VSTSIASVTMAYNGGEAFVRQLEALLAQTLRLQEIVVVDDGPSDRIAVMVRQRYPQITVLKAKENLGAAGAWAAGLSYALEKGHDWIWTLDDDSVPALDSLATLLGGLRFLNGARAEVGMIAPMPAHRETGTCYSPMLWRDGFVKPIAEQMSEPLWFADLVIASGSLVHREVVERVGLPRADFFMDIADFEYSLRVRAYGYKIAVILSAALEHEIGNTREVRLLGRRRSWISHPPWREYYISRNLIYLAWRLYPSCATKLSISRHLAAHLVGTLLFSSDRIACAIRIIQGLADGLRGRMGIRLQP
jgi:GT2 family glycosyltransferase